MTCYKVKHVTHWKEITYLTRVWLFSEKCGENVLFTARDMDQDKTKAGEPAIFRTVWTNEGGCFDATTGVFTVKVPGSYVFTATAGSVRSDNSIVADVTIDGTDYAFLRGSYTSVGSCSVAVMLSAGQKVWMKAYSTPGHYCYPEASFSGALITPLL